MLVLHCMKTISRNTTVVSVSLKPETVKTLDRVRSARGQSRSAFISALIQEKAEVERWQRIYEYGRQTALKFGITSEADIDRIIHGR